MPDDIGGRVVKCADDDGRSIPSIRVNQFAQSFVVHGVDCAAAATSAAFSAVTANAAAAGRANFRKVTTPRTGTGASDKVVLLG